MSKENGLVCADGQEVALKSISAHGYVNDLLLTLTVKQIYKNTTPKTLETTYTFPIGWGATFMGLKVEINGEILNGTVLAKQLANDQYEKAISNGDSPIMLEKNSDGLYTVTLGNLKPGEEAIIEYSYAQLLTIKDRTLRLTIPTAVAPRFGNSEMGGIKEYQSVSSDLFSEYPFKLSIEINGSLSSASFASPSHQISTQSQPNKTIVTLEKNAYLDRDFILNLEKIENQSFFSIIKDNFSENHSFTALASFCPQLDIKNQEPIDLKVLVDCSGSMAGDSINSAKNALHTILKNLKISDRFSYSKFGSHVTHMFKALKPVNKMNVAAASAMISLTEADMGGTEFELALKSVFNLPGSDRQSDVLLITDGEIWEVESIIAEAKKSKNRVFAIGVGTTPVESLLQRLAEETNGACELISPNEDIESAIVRMFSRIRTHNAQEISIDWGSEPIWVTRIPSTIYNGDTIHVFAGFEKEPQKPALLKFKQGGNFGNVSAISIATGCTDLTRTAAMYRLPNIEAENKLSLALRYQLITDETSFILIHERSELNKANDLPELQKIPQMHSAGWGGTGSVEIVWRNTSATIIKHSLSDTQSFAMYDKYDVPKVFRTNRQSSIQNDNLDITDYDIPAFLRKQPDNREITKSVINISKSTYQAVKEKLIKAKPLSPEDIIKLASDFIKYPNDLNKFINSIEGKLINNDLKNVQKILEYYLTSEQMWLIILSWLLINFETSKYWSSNTKTAIQDLCENIDSTDISESFVILVNHMPNLEIDNWN